MGKKTRRIKRDKKGNSYVYSYSHRYDKKKKKTIQGKSNYLGKFDGTYDKDGNPNYIPSRSSSPIELKKFWDIFLQSVENDTRLKNKTLLYFLIEAISSPATVSDEKFDNLVNQMLGKQFLIHTKINPHLDKICLRVPIYFKSWIESLRSYFVILIEKETGETLQLFSSTHTYIDEKLENGYFPVLSGNTKKLIENLKYDTGKDFVIISKDYIEGDKLSVWFEQHGYYVYAHEEYPIKQQITQVLHRLQFFENILPHLYSLVFKRAIDRGHDYYEFLEAINVFVMKLYEIFSSVEAFDFKLIENILRDNLQFIKIGDDWILLNEQVKLI